MLKELNNEARLLVLGYRTHTDLPHNRLMPQGLVCRKRGNFCLLILVSCGSQKVEFSSFKNASYFSIRTSYST